MGRSKKGAVVALLLLAACSQAQGDVIVLDADHAAARPSSSMPDVSVLSNHLTATDPPTPQAPAGDPTATTAEGATSVSTMPVNHPPAAPSSSQTTSTTKVAPASPPSTTTPRSATTTQTSMSTTTTSKPPPPMIEGSPAPDFTIRLLSGSEFTLSSEDGPVLLYSWADW